MPQVTIENSILNSPFSELTRHFRFDEDGITSDVVEARRISSYFMPIARPRKEGKQAHFETEWTRDRIQENKRVDPIRQRVAAWREGGHVGVTATTARLLDYWTDPAARSAQMRGSDMTDATYDVIIVGARCARHACDLSRAERCFGPRPRQGRIAERPDHLHSHCSSRRHGRPRRGRRRRCGSPGRAGDAHRAPA